MLHDLTEWEGLAVRATDGEVGTVEGFYFDDKRWVIRRLVVDTGQWLRGGSVVISPGAVKVVPWDSDSLHVCLNLQQLIEAADIDDRPVSGWLRSTNEVAGLLTMTTDGPIGTLQSFVFDDESWAIVYLVMDAANWLPGKRVLISPARIKRVIWPARELCLDITRQEIRASPDYTRRLISSRSRLTRPLSAVPAVRYIGISGASNDQGWPPHWD